jgi:hypothetical protein
VMTEAAKGTSEAKLLAEPEQPALRAV